MSDPHAHLDRDRGYEPCNCDQALDLKERLAQEYKDTSQLLTEVRTELNVARAEADYWNDQFKELMARAVYLENLVLTTQAEVCEAAAAERAVIVAWLREDYKSGQEPAVADWYADRIEAGAHHRKEPGR
jgi:hypothetical protein